MRDSDAIRFYRFGFVLTAAILVGVAFLFVIHTFILDIILAAIFAGLAAPSFQRLVPAVGHSKGAAAAIILVGALLAIGMPLTLVATIVVSEAIKVSGSAVVWMQHMIAHPDTALAMLPKKLVGTKEFQNLIAAISAHVADMVGVLSGFVSASLASVFSGVARLFLDLFVVSFAFIYFLQNGPRLTEMLIQRIPVSRDQTRAIVNGMLRTTAATLRSVVVGGTVDGVLIGIGFALFGLGAPWFWGAVAVVASQAPVLGCAVVWIPAAAYLLITGHVLPAMGLALWGTLINTVVDNLLRAHIIGRGSAIPGFLVLVSTIGGITTLGPAGLLIGPVLAGMLIATFDLYFAVVHSPGISATGTQKQDDASNSY